MSWSGAALWCTAIGALTLCGCGGSEKPIRISGTLQWEDGKSVQGATVRFVPSVGGKEAVGYAGKDGTFALSTFGADDGAVPGEYVIVVTKVEEASYVPPPPSGGTPEDLAKAMKGLKESKKKIVDPIPAVYTSPKSSPLKWKVDSSTTKVELTLKKG